MGAISDDDKKLRDLQNIFGKKFGIDLSNYGSDFLKRRIERRLDDLGLTNYSEYLAQLLKDPEEHRRLIQALSVEVTEFFRDTELYKAISGKVLPAILETKNKGADSIRAWSAGCATGEEAYTLAMVIDFHLLEQQQSGISFSISATDVNQQFLAGAKTATYAKEKIQKIPWFYRGRYFVDESDTACRLIPPIRHSIKFFKHDLTSKQIVPNNDLILCRNVLIYMSPEKREEIINFLYDCLVPGGFLIMGGAESITKSDAFETIDVKNCIYRKPPKNGPRSNTPPAQSKRPPPPPPPPKPAAPVAPAAAPTLAKNLVIIGASTGGPKVLKNIISKLPHDLNAAVLVVQHLSEKFTALVIAGLACTSTMPIKKAQTGDMLLNGQILFAPGDTSIRVVRFGDGAKVELTQQNSPHKIQPWIDLAMESGAEVFKKRCAAVLLTGMGADGALGMMKVKKVQGETFAQDEATSLIFGMPQEAIKKGTVNQILPAKDIASAIKDHVDSLG